MDERIKASLLVSRKATGAKSFMLSWKLDPIEYAGVDAAGRSRDTKLVPGRYFVLIKAVDVRPRSIVIR